MSPAIGAVKKIDANESKSNGDADSDRHVTAPLPQRKHDSSSTQKTILVVDDEVEVLRVLSRLLTSLGWNVIASNGVAHACEQLTGGKICRNVVLTDMALLDGTGADVLDCAEKTVPAARLIAMSGYFETTEKIRERLDNGLLMLYKPFRLTELARILEKPDEPA